ncbi:MAG: hypothetical protein GY809_10175, partial [Planctomycetes bacterium]|nr:hypothetical protein [Planctomycetota bacterium]
MANEDVGQVKGAGTTKYEGGEDQAPAVVLVREGNSPPEAPEGHLYVPTGAVYESMPPQYEYRLLQEIVLVREGQQPPNTPPGYQYAATGRVYESMPPQIEFKLEKTVSQAQGGEAPKPDVNVTPPEQTPWWVASQTGGSPKRTPAFAQEPIRVREGEELPNAPQGYKFIPTGLVY